jgi:hypothetical protein
MTFQNRILTATATMAILLLVCSQKTLAQAAPADAANPNAPASAAPDASATIAATATATIAAVDPANRVVILQTADGDMIPIKCGEQVRNFDQIKPGDQVKAMAVDRVAVSIEKGAAAAGADAAAGSGGAGRMIMRAPKGEKPGIVIVDTVPITAKVDAVDAAAQTVTLQGPDGKPMKLGVGPEVELSGIEKGDDVTIRATSGIAIVVESAQGGAAQPAAGAVKPDDAAAARGSGAGAAAAAGGAVTRTATVESVDKDKRTVTLKTAEGQTRTIHLGKEAINFDQIKAGDQVRATLAEEVAISLDKSGAAPSATGERVVALAPKGGKPGMLIADSEQLTAKIESIDASKRTVTLAVPGSDKPRQVKVAPKVDLTQLKAGDDVTARVTKALAIVVEKPQSSAPQP